jgi:hypothetical protein
MLNLSLLTFDMWAVVVRIFYLPTTGMIFKFTLILLSCDINSLDPSFSILKLNVFSFATILAFKQIHLVSLQLVSLISNLIY